IDAFGGARRRPFDAEPWRLAFTPSGCDVFSASDRGGGDFGLRGRAAVFARVSTGNLASPVAKFTQLGGSLFSPLGKWPATGHGAWRGGAIFGDRDPCRGRRRTGLSFARCRQTECAARTSHDLPTLEAHSRLFRGATRRRHSPRGPCTRLRPLGMLSRP